MVYQIFSIVFPVFAIVVAGFIYARHHLPDMAAANKLNMDIFTPALIFSVLSSDNFHVAAYGELALGAAFVVLGSGLLAWPVSRLFGYDTKTFVPPVMFTNSGNMGLPLAVFAFGEMALPAAVMLFIVENTLHFTVGSRIMDKRAPLGMIFRLPMLIATIGGLVVSLVELRIPTVIATPIEMVGQVAIPLMLFSLGVRLISIDYSDWKVGLVAAVTTPVTGVVLALAYHAVLPVPDSQFALFILFGALPPAVLNFMVAEKYAQEPARVASIVMLGNLASIVTVPIVLAFVL